VNPDAPHIAYTIWRHGETNQTALYVGCTSQFHRRMREHIRTQAWADQIGEVTYHTFPNRRQALIAEYILIRDHDPLHNVHKRQMPWPMSALLQSA
jgi:excinuclease UvrABC nuclease subunit